MYVCMRDATCDISYNNTYCHNRDSMKNHSSIIHIVRSHVSILYRRYLDKKQTSANTYLARENLSCSNIKFAATCICITSRYLCLYQVYGNYILVDRERRRDNNIITEIIIRGY